MNRRVVITGMGIITPLGDALEDFLGNLLAGRSAISLWRGIDAEGIDVKFGGDLSDYDIAARLGLLSGILPGEVFARTRRLVRRVPWSTKLSLLAGLAAFSHAGGFSGGVDFSRVTVLVSGHNLNGGYHFSNMRAFLHDRDRVDPLAMLLTLDTDHASCLSEALGVTGGLYTIGGACASGNIALRSGVDEIRHHEAQAVLVVGPAFDFSAAELHAMALLGTVPTGKFNNRPAEASRPFDREREGFVPSHGCGAMVLEDRGSAIARGARIFAEILEVDVSSDGSHLPQPSEDGQVGLLTRALAACGVAGEDVDFVSAHAASTEIGDAVEARTISRVFRNCKNLKVNAPKSLLGHTCYASAIVEIIAAILQMNASTIHPSANIDQLDPAVEFDLCRGKPVPHAIRHFVKNSFGFGGINSVSVFRNPDLFPVV